MDGWIIKVMRGNGKWKTENGKWEMGINSICVKIVVILLIIIIIMIVRRGFLPAVDIII